MPGPGGPALVPWTDGGGAGPPPWEVSAVTRERRCSWRTPAFCLRRLAATRGRRRPPKPVWSAVGGAASPAPNTAWAPSLQVEAAPAPPLWLQASPPSSHRGRKACHCPRFAPGTAAFGQAQAGKSLHGGWASASLVAWPWGPEQSLGSGVCVCVCARVCACVHVCVSTRWSAETPA